MGKHKHKLAAEAAEVTGSPVASGPPPYTGTWTLTARKTDAVIDLHDIKSFELVNGIWFISNDEGVTAIAIANWDYIQLTKDEVDESS